MIPATELPAVGLDEEKLQTSLAVRVDFFFEPQLPPGLITLAIESSENSENVQAVEIEVGEPGTYEVALDASKAWRLTCNSSDFWCPQTTVVPDPEAVVVELYVPVFQAATITGKVQVDRQRDTPPTVVVQGWLRLAEALEPATSFIQDVDIEEKGDFRLKAPAGFVDLRIAANGWVPRYLWGVKSKGVTDLGSLYLQPGGSLSGFVWDTVTSLPDHGANVRLVAAGATQEAMGDRRIEKLVHEAKANDRGFFQLSGVPEGVYRLEVSAENRARQTVEPVEIRQDSEVFLNRRVDLAPLIYVEFHVDPAMSPTNEPWMIRLTSRRHRVDEDWVRSSVTDASGIASFSDLLPQEYQLEILDSAGEVRFLLREESIYQDDVFFYEIPVVLVEGTLTFNGDPMAASITVQTGDKDEATFVSETSSGEFSGLLRRPNHDVLLVTVRSEQPSFDRRLVVRDPRVKKGKLNLELDLVGVDVPCVVVDANGMPVRDATVTAWLGSDIVTTAKSDPNGELTLKALDKGHYQLLAKSRTKGNSEPVALDVWDGASPPNQRLVLQPRRQLAGVLRSADGQPLPGVQVAVIAVGAVPTSARAETDVEGKFRLEVGAEATHGLFQVLAPSQVLWSGCIPIDPNPNQPLPLTLPPMPGGHLEIHWAGTRDGPPDTTRQPILVTSEGGLLTFNELWNWTIMTGSSTEHEVAVDHWVFPRLAANQRYAATRSADPLWQIAASLCLVGPSPELDWVYLPEGVSEVIEFGSGEPGSESP